MGNMNIIMVYHCRIIDVNDEKMWALCFQANPYPCVLIISCWSYRARMTGRIDLTVCCFSLGTQMILMIHQMPLLWFCVGCIMSLQWMSNRNRKSTQMGSLPLPCQIAKVYLTHSITKVGWCCIVFAPQLLCSGICPSCLNYNDLWRHWWELDAGNHPQMSLSFSYVQVRVLISGWECHHPNWLNWLSYFSEG
jgi:hypothetical protein